MALFRNSTLSFIVAGMLCINFGCATTTDIPVETTIEHRSLSPVSNLQNHIFLYLIHGLDPLDWADLNGVVRHCNNLGYHNVKLVQHHEGNAVIEHAVAAKSTDSQARMVIFGFSAGAASTRRVVRLLHECHGINVDVVLYTGGIILLDTPYSRPEYVGKIIHILDGGRLIPGVPLTGAENHRFTDVWHFGTPTHPQTLSILDRELSRLSNSISTP